MHARMIDLTGFYLLIVRRGLKPTCVAQDPTCLGFYLFFFFYLLCSFNESFVSRLSLDVLKIRKLLIGWCNGSRSGVTLFVKFSFIERLDSIHKDT